MRRSQLHTALVELGFSLVREKKHLIYRHANGAQLVVANTPSDQRSCKNALATARRLASGEHHAMQRHR